MECDVIPDCAQEVDPLGNVDNCQVLSNENSLYMGSLNAQLITSESFSIITNNRKALTITPVASTSGIQSKMPKELSASSSPSSSLLTPKAVPSSSSTSPTSKSQVKAIAKHQNQSVRKKLSRVVVKKSSKPVTVHDSSSSSSGNKINDSSMPSEIAIFGQHGDAVHNNIIKDNDSIMISKFASGTTDGMQARSSTITKASASTGAASATTATQQNVKTQAVKTTGRFHGVFTALASSSNTQQQKESKPILSPFPSFSSILKMTRRRPYKKMSTAAQLEQIREGYIDLETPDSILVGTHIRELLNHNTFNLLPPEYQRNLIQLLPCIDRPDVQQSSTEPIVLQHASLANEFFTLACGEWRERLAEGEFTPEKQMRRRMEAEKEKAQVDPWKIKHFEAFWGEKFLKKKESQDLAGPSTNVSAPASPTSFSSTPDRASSTICKDKYYFSAGGPKSASTSANASTSTASSCSYTTSSGRIVKSPNSSMASASAASTSNLAKRGRSSCAVTCTGLASWRNCVSRSGGAVTRSSAATTTVTSEENPCVSKNSIPVPDLLPISSTKAMASTSKTSLSTLVSFASTSVDRTEDTASLFELITKPYDLDNLNKYPDIEIIKRDSNTIDKSIPHDIPADIELIPMSTEPSTSTSTTTRITSTAAAATTSTTITKTSSANNARRAPKRSFSPENTISKISKLNDFGSLSCTSATAIQISSPSSSSSTSSSSSKYLQLKKDCSIEKMNSNHFQEAIDKNIITLSKISHKVPNSFSISETILGPTSTATSILSGSSSSPPPSPSLTSALLTSTNNSIAIGQIDSNDDNIENLPVGSFRFRGGDHPLINEMPRGTNLAVGRYLLEGSSFTSRISRSAEKSTSLDKHPSAAQKTSMVDADELMIMDATSIDSIDHHMHTEIVTTANSNDESKLMQQFSNDSSEYSNSEHVVSSGNASDIITGTNALIASVSTSSNSDNIIDVYDSTFHTNATDDNLISVGDGGVSGGFCSTADENSGQDDVCPDSDGCDNDESIKSTIALDNIFKIQNFEGVLQIQPHSLIMEQQPKIHSQIIDDTVIVHDDFMISNMAIGDDSSSSTAALADCSGDNSADTGVEELEPTIQNLEPLEDDPIEQKFTDAENYVLESGEISGDSGEASSLAVGPKICGSDDIQADLFAAAMARAFDTVPGNVPASMTVTNPTENPEVTPMQEMLEVRLKDSSFHVNSEWMGNILNEHGLNQSDEFVKTNGTATVHPTSLSQQQQQQQLQSQRQQGNVSHSQNQKTIYSTTSQVKLELEVTLTPETEVTSTVTSNNSNNSCDSDQSQELPSVSSSSNNSNSSTTMACLPNMVSLTNSMSQQPIIGNIQRPATYINSVAAHQQSSSSQQGQLQQIFHKNGQQRTAQIQLSQQAKKIIQGGQIIQNSNLNHQIVVASSSSLPFLSLSSNQTMRATIAGTIPQSQIVAQHPQQSLPQQQQPQPQSQQQQPNSVQKICVCLQKNCVCLQKICNGSTKISKIPGKGGRGSRSNSNRPPPGAVNLERSYQICQAVIQNSPNRHQLKGQLKPPPSMLPGPGPAVPGVQGVQPSLPVLPATATTTTTAIVQNVNTCRGENVPLQGVFASSASTTTIKRDQAVSSTNRTVYKTATVNGPARIAFPKKNFGQRQASPVLLRHVYTSNQGIPVSMAVLPNGANGTNNTQQIQTTYQTISTDGNQTIGQGGQYILVQRAGIITSENHSAPRASSAPPAQNQQTHATIGIPISGRGRPASVDVDAQSRLSLGTKTVGITRANSTLVRSESRLCDVDTQNSTVIEIHQQPQQSNPQQPQPFIGPSPGLQAVTRKLPNQSIIYGDISMDTTLQNYSITAGENTPPNCACTLNPMVICQQCGAFCHDDCMDSTKLCVSCIIR